MLKKTRHSLEVEGEDGEQIILGTDGVDFDFENDAGCEVCAASVVFLLPGFHFYVLDYLGLTSVCMFRSTSVKGL